MAKLSCHPRGYHDAHLPLPSKASSQPYCLSSKLGLILIILISRQDRFSNVASYPPIYGKPRSRRTTGPYTPLAEKDNKNAAYGKGSPEANKRTVSKWELAIRGRAREKHRLGIGRDDLQSYAILYPPDIPIVSGSGDLWGHRLAHRSAIPRNNCVVIQIWGENRLDKGHQESREDFGSIPYALTIKYVG
jgi:hypothetical protein